MISVLLLIVIIFFLINLRESKLKNFPAGPRKLSITSSLLSVGFDLKSAFMRWWEQHGPIVGSKLGSHTSVVISDFDMLSEAFKDD